jgi:hypothetical protein
MLTMFIPVPPLLRRDRMWLVPESDLAAPSLSEGLSTLMRPCKKSPNPPIPGKALAMVSKA